MNKSLFTQFRRKVHDARRDIDSIIDNPFASSDDKDLARSVISQLDFVLALTKIEDVLT